MPKLLRKIVNFSIYKRPLNKIFIWGFLLFAAGFIFSVLSVNQTTVKAQVNQLNIDAIAVRVLSNPENYSALRWYKEQGFTGSPQSLIVDGYEAIRDNRTVFVNVANVSGSTFFTNIYLISYNQDAEKATQDIFSQILSHWKFNTNLTIPGTCNESTGINCLIDSECPLGDYCLSDKARVTRDTRRLADLADIRTELYYYSQTNGYYPKLDSGSYLRGRSVSTWPSWRDKFSSDLNYNLPIDPVNRMGDCGGVNFNEVTCWDEMAMQFPGGDPASNLPANSQVYVYSVASDGASYDVCAVMQSGYISGAGSGACSSGTANNTPPLIVNSSFPDACQGEEYSAYVEAYDSDSDTITWSLNGSWGASLEDVPGFPNKKRIYAASAGSVGTYNFQVGVSDGRGGTANGNYTVTVINCIPACTVNCSTGPGCRSSLTNGWPTGGQCCGNGYCYDCNSGYNWNGSICEASCSVNCSSGPGCRFSLAYGQVVGGECCGNGSCYNCVSGYSWNGSVCALNCVPNCSTGPGCRTGLSNGQVVNGDCCGSGSCYECVSGTTWNGSVCFSPCVTTCSTGPGCRSSLSNGQVVAGECCGSGSCYNCASGYNWNGSSCVASCVISCVGPFGCRTTAPSNSQVVAGECCSTGSCYGCASGYSWDGSSCQPDCVPTCSTGPGCRSSLSNGQVVAGECCGSGSCYNCASGYEWNGSSCVLIPTCGVYFQGALVGSPTWGDFYAPFEVSVLSNWVTNGSYPNNSTAFPNAQYATLDGIAVDANVRLEVWVGTCSVSTGISCSTDSQCPSGESCLDGENYGGTKVLDVVGPVVINNYLWESPPMAAPGLYVDPYTLASCFGLNTSIWTDCRLSTEDMDPWGDNGSSIITCL